MRFHRRKLWLVVGLVLALITLVALHPYGLQRPVMLSLDIDSRYMHPPPEGATPHFPFHLRDPDRYLLIVYVNGSTTEGKPDPCDTSRPGINIPYTATDLSGRYIAGYEVLLYAFCTRSKIGGFNQEDGDGVPKVIRRAQELEALLQRIRRAGFPPSRTFVMGQSAGGWAGLLVQRWGKVPHAGLVAFAPAFAGLHGRRRLVWQIERDRQAALIAEAPRIDALVFGFEQDRYEPPKAMGWLQDIPGIHYVTLSGHSINGVDCENRFPHATVFKDCFRYSQRRRIMEYIAERLAVPTG